MFTSELLSRQIDNNTFKLSKDAIYNISKKDFDNINKAHLTEIVKLLTMKYCNQYFELIMTDKVDEIIPKAIDLMKRNFGAIENLEFFDTVKIDILGVHWRSNETIYRVYKFIMYYLKLSINLSIC